MNENMKDFDMIRKIMVWAGQWQEFSTYPRLKIFLQKFRVTYLMVLSPLPLTSMFLSGFMDSLSKYALFAVGATLIDPMAYSFFFEWDLAKKVYTRLRAIVARRDSEEHIKRFKTKSRPIWIVVAVYALFTFLFVFFYEIMPYFYDAYLFLFTGSDKPFMTPIPNQGFMDKEPKRTFYYYCSNVFTTLWCMDLAMIVFGFDSLTYLVVIYTCIEVEIISERVKSWGEKGADPAELREIIEEHNEVLRLTDDMIELLGGPMASQNTVGSLAITIFAYTVLVKYETDLFLVIVNGLSVGLTFLVIATANYVGDRLEDEGVRFFQSLYDTPWYNMPQKERKAIRIMMCQAVKPLVITYKGWSPLNFVTLMDVVNASYSYFMVLKSMN
ncbi:odorant receptor 46a-like [Cimex lectularius]|uniref:Odorant receptor n=1 Tax=Cimex lectularius TaxID=79782 RepID=A0A8I6S474_CIMLE|nr:odorant receptor 46a-like [Cimex lectularius]